MPAPNKRSRSRKRVTKTLPGGKSTVHYVKRRPQPAKCAVCGAVLKGVARERPFKMAKIGISEKRPARPFGGYLCSICSREHMKSLAR